MSDIPLRATRSKLETHLSDWPPAARQLIVSATAPARHQRRVEKTLAAAIREVLLRWGPGRDVEAAAAVTEVPRAAVAAVLALDLHGIGGPLGAGGDGRQTDRLLSELGSGRWHASDGPAYRAAAEAALAAVLRPARATTTWHTDATTGGLYCNPLDVVQLDRPAAGWESIRIPPTVDLDNAARQILAAEYTYPLVARWDAVPMGETDGILRFALGFLIRRAGDEEGYVTPVETPAHWQLPTVRTCLLQRIGVDFPAPSGINAVGQARNWAALLEQLTTKTATA